MRKILFVSDEANEAQGVFSEEGQLLGGWFTSDANWRDEYFGPLMSNLGLKLEDRSDDEDLVASLRSHLSIS